MEIDQICDTVEIQQISNDLSESFKIIRFCIVVFILGMVFLSHAAHEIKDDAERANPVLRITKVTVFSFIIYLSSIFYIYSNVYLNHEIDKIMRCFDNQSLITNC